MTAPPVPPRPFETFETPPPPPPLPAELRAPRPHHPAQIDQLNWSPWGAQVGSYNAASVQDVSQSIANLSLVSPPPALPSAQNPPPQMASPQPISSISAPLPQLAQLESATPVVTSPNHDPALKIAWCRDIFFLVERQRHEVVTPSTDPIVGPVNINDPALARLAPLAVQMVLQLSSQQPMVPYVAEAIYWRAMLAASGGFPAQVKQNPRVAFRDFEAAARAGHGPAWFRLGRDYENFNDHTHAKDCFERGVKLGVESCLYRMGMANLLGQLSLSSNPTVALPLLHRAATLASVDVPQPAYVYALLLLGEFTQIAVSPQLFTPYIPPNSSPTLEARKHLERAAYLHFAAAQYKLGHAYEFAEPPFPFDPLLSVQYYSLASQQGEPEADMALSKWFLCGSTGATAPGSDATTGGFEKDEALALTFAEKAAKKGLASAEFAMGYYAEVGVGRPKDLNEATLWYRKASVQGNEDATARLQALSGPAAQTLSRQEHDAITETKLVRRRTKAAQRSETQPLSPPWNGTSFPTIAEVQQQQQQGQQKTPDYQPPQRPTDGRVIVENIRKNSIAQGPSAVAPGSAYDQSRPPRQPHYQQSLPGPAGNDPRNRIPSAATPATSGRQPSPGRRVPQQSDVYSAPPVGGAPPQQPGGKLARMRLNETGHAQSLPPGGYSLQDPGPGPGSAPSYNGKPASARPSPSVSPMPPSSNPAPAPVHGGGGKRPQTFAEMGFQSAKTEDEKCVIM